MKFNGNGTVEARVRNSLMNLLADEARQAAMRLLLRRLKEILSAEDFSAFVESCRNRMLDDGALLAKIGADSEAMTYFNEWLSATGYQQKIM